jgi:hypothetical protein
MRTLCYIWTLLFLLPAAAQPVAGPPGGIHSPVKWTVERSSLMIITGHSNIGGFSCDIMEYLEPDTLLFWPDKGYDRSDFLSGGLSLDIRQFDCHHGFITRDFRRILKSDDYPKLNIRFLSMDRFETGNDVRHIKGWVTIELAGVTRKFDIDYSCRPYGYQQLLLSGTRDMRFSDFNLTPPSRLAGLVRIEQGIRVEFRLLLKRL